MKKIEENKYIIRLIFSIVFLGVYYYFPVLFTVYNSDIKYAFLIVGLGYLCSAIEGLVSK